MGGGLDGALPMQFRLKASDAFLQGGQGQDESPPLCRLEDEVSGLGGEGECMLRRLWITLV
jgi:hypothetical protein